MKKLLRYLIISIIIVTIFIGLGYAVYTCTDNAFLARELPGGEMSAHVGIGFVVEKYYPLCTEEDDLMGGETVLHRFRISTFFRYAVYRHTIFSFYMH